MFRPATVGQRIPAADLAELSGGERTVVSSERLFAGRRAVVMGMPGAYSPTCERQHMPDFIANADLLRASGFDLLACVVVNDPWVMDRWARDIDPDQKIRFLSDGNLDLTRKLGLVARGETYHLGERSARYCMILQNAVIERLSVENALDDFSCSRSALLLAS